MSNFFSKPIDQITAHDILKVKDTPEGQLFEIKGMLASENSSNPDSWYTTPDTGKSRKGPGDYAKLNIFKEIVAFANAEGGWLVLGLKETNDKPKRVDSILPLPECHDLAERLERAAVDSIDPPIPSLRFRGVETDPTCEGVVVCRVPRSQIAPHRINLKRSQKAFKRINEESREIKMREIQDITIEMTRGQQRVDNQYADARKRYFKVYPQDSTSRYSYVGFRITSVPQSGPLIIDRPYLQPSLFERKDGVVGRFDDGCVFTLKIFERMLHFKTESSRGSTQGVNPILRGGERTWSSSYIRAENERVEDKCVLEVFESGTVNFIFKSSDITPKALSINWILADLANVLRVTRETRLLGNNPEAEYAVEVEILLDKHHIPGKEFEELNREIFFGFLPDEMPDSFKKRIRPVLLPRLRVTTEDDFPRILKQVMDDIYNAAGKQHIEDFSFLPFDFNG